MAEPLDGDWLPTVSGKASSAGPPTPGADVPRPQFPGLEILDETAPGTGSMGRVYRVRETSLDRIVAVKTVRPEMLTAEGRAFFEREARAAARLKHPNIVRIHAFNPDHSPPYYVMEFVEGRHLDAACAGRPAAFVAEMLEKVAGALAYAHSRGVVHRDIKPANILVDFQNEPHLADFGLAQQWSDDPVDTDPAETHAAGTPFFMAPEVYLGEGGAGPATDVFALGVTMYRLLTGRYPFTGKSREELRRSILTGEPPLPQEINPAVPEPLQRICLKAIERHPEARYAGAQALAEDLRRFREGHEVFARPTRYDAELRGKLQNHVTEVRMWQEHRLIEVREMDAIVRPYEKLMAAELPWHDLVRRFPWETTILRLGGWLVLVGSILWLYYWDRLARHDRILSVGVPVLLLNLVGWFFHRRGNRSTAFVFLSVGALLVPLFLGVLLTEYHLFRAPQPAEWELFNQPAVDALAAVDGLAPAAPDAAPGPAPVFAPTNMQMVVSLGAMVAYLLVLLAVTRARTFVFWVGLAVYALFTAILLRCGMKEQLDAHPMHAVPTLVRYVALAVGFGVVAMILEWRRRSEWAAAFYLFFPAPFALLMTLLARRGGVEWFGAADDWREESIGLWLMANGLVYLGLALWSGRARSNYVRFWGDLLMWIVPVSLLVPPDLLCRKGIELVKIGGEWFTSYELASLVLSVGLVVLGTRMRRYSMALSGLGGMAAFIVIVTLLHFPHDLLWPLSLTAVGGAAMAAAVLFIVIRARQRPYATM